MATELAALALIREQTAVPVPAVDFADLSQELCDADYFFMPFVDADNFGIVRKTLTAAEADRYNEALGAANRELNSDPRRRLRTAVRARRSRPGGNCSPAWSPTSWPTANAATSTSAGTTTLSARSIAEHAGLPGRGDRAPVRRVGPVGQQRA